MFVKTFTRKNTSTYIMCIRYMCVDCGKFSSSIEAFKLCVKETIFKLFLVCVALHIHIIVVLGRCTVNLFLPLLNFV
jgi:hypothetical protein